MTVMPDFFQEFSEIARGSVNDSLPVAELTKSAGTASKHLRIHTSKIFCFDLLINPIDFAGNAAFPDKIPGNIEEIIGTETNVLGLSQSKLDKSRGKVPRPY